MIRFIKSFFLKKRNENAIAEAIEFNETSAAAWWK